MIKQLLEEGFTVDEVAKTLMQKYGISEPEARFRIDLELGRTKGDVDLDYQGDDIGDFEFEPGSPLDA